MEAANKRCRSCHCVFFYINFDVGNTYTNITAQRLDNSKDHNLDNIIPREDGSWLCEGLTPIDDIEDLLQIKIISEFEENDFNTLAGFLLIHLKHIPKAGELVHWDTFKFEIMDMDRTRIDKVLIQKK